MFDEFNTRLSHYHLLSIIYDNVMTNISYYLKNMLCTFECIGYVDPVNPTKLFETAVSAMLKVRRKKEII